MTARIEGGKLCLVVTDDGRGGAGVDGSSGLTGIRGRVAAHDGFLHLTSPLCRLTTAGVVLPGGS